MQAQDYYKTLGVGEKATEAEVKKAFRKLAKQHHPDVCPNDKSAEDKFKKINEAYEVLGNAQRRKEYDELRRNIGSEHTSFDPSQYGYANRNTSNAGGNFGGFNGSTAFGGEGSGFSDFFDMLFGGARAQQGDIFNSRQASPAAFHGGDIEAAIELTVEEAYHGVKKQVSLELDGRRKTIEFAVPQGTAEGDRIRLAGQGQPGSGKAQSGDLLITVHLTSGKYEPNGLDLIADIKLSPWEAALGAKAGYRTLDGEITVKVPAGVQTGCRIRIAGKGFKNRRGQQGDLYLRVKIVNPSTLSSEEKNLYEQLSKISTFTAAN